MGAINFTFPGLPLLLNQIWLFIVFGPALLICLFFCLKGLLELVGTGGRQGWAGFIGSPVVFFIIMLLPNVFPQFGAGGA